MASSIEGVPELLYKLGQLSDPRKYGRELLAAVKAGMEPVLKKARANIGEISPGEREFHRLHTGAMAQAGFAAKNIRVKAFWSRDKTMAAAILGPRRDAYYASQFHELGTSRLPRHEWLVPAFEQQKNSGVRLIADGLRKRIEKIARANAKRGW